MAKTNTKKPTAGSSTGLGKPGSMSTWQLALMTAAAVISLRGLPMMAQEELTMFFYILFATVLFLIPASLVSAELGGAFAAKGGGVYTWVKEAYNKKAGFLAIFLQWIQNVAWYPIVLGFAAAAIAYTIGKPELADNGKFVGIFSIAVYWLATLLTFKGSSIVSKITSRGFLIGTVLPGIVIIVMALVWIIGGNPIAFKELPASVPEIASVTAGHPHPRFFPHMTGLSDLAFLAGIVLLFAGVEVHAVHANELRNPQKQYPKAMFIAAIMSFLIFTLGALAMAVITPYKDISLQSGLMESFRYVFDHYHIGWMTNVVSLLVAFGALAGVLSWIAGPSRGLLWTARDGRNDTVRSHPAHRQQRHGEKKNRCECRDERLRNGQVIPLQFDKKARTFHSSVPFFSYNQTVRRLLRKAADGRFRTHQNGRPNATVPTDNR